MRGRFDYHGTRRALARHLLRNAEAHEAGSHNYLDKGYERIEHAVPREGYPEIETLLIALDFWRAWIEGCRGGWRDSVGIAEADWPRLARAIVAALESDIEIDEPELTSRFGPRRPER